MIDRITSFFVHDIWRLERQSLSRMRRFGLNVLRVLTLSFRDFVKDACSLRASALTFFSLLAIVPTFAVAFGVAQGFGLDKRLETLLYQQLSGQEAVAERIVEFSRALLENTQGGVLAGVGILVLLWSIIKLIGHIEQAFNQIWQVGQGRTLIRKFADYTAIMIVCPLLLLLASSSTVIVTARLEQLTEEISLLTHVGPAISVLLKMSPLLTVWILFTFIYMIIPYTKVNFFAALTGGVIAGSAYQLLQVVFVNAQIGVSQYSAIYGSFAALPLFLMWLQLSWMIVLFGAEFAYAQQNAPSFEFEPDTRSASLKLRCLAALSIVQYCIKRFSDDGAKAPNQREIGSALGIPPSMVEELLEKLVAASVLVKVEASKRLYGYQPATTPSKLSIVTVIDKLIRHGTDVLPTLSGSEADKLTKRLESLLQQLVQSGENVGLG